MTGVQTVLFGAACILAGAAVTSGIALCLHHAWVGEHDARRTWLEHTNVQGVYRESDHNLRLARRLARALDAADAIYRQQVGDLLDTVADRDRTIADLTRPRHARRSPVPDYGRWAA